MFAVARSKDKIKHYRPINMKKVNFLMNENSLFQAEDKEQAITKILASSAFEGTIEECEQHVKDHYLLFDVDTREVLLFGVQ